MKIKYLYVVLLLVSMFFSSFAQEEIKTPKKYTETNKGKFFISWGGNRESFSESDITFRGDDYHFTLYDVVAHDKPKGYHIDYVNPSRMTIPQTNFRMGYFINNHYSIAIALDHMKYVMYQDREVAINGYYPNPGSYGEVLPDDKILLTEDFLTFEHTDGLNYINTEFSRYDDISTLFKINNTDKIQINLTEGISGGVLYPKTNAKLLVKERHDDFHVSGFGAAVKAGLNITFLKHFYLQAELKTGYINMQDIRTTKNSSDKASQDFFFFQRIIQLGGIFRL
ncbi:MAG: hypothetical protein KA215_07120 [Flavobacterium sp.]|jgi:hypothetical protein|nr:hypothetical protein [Flavobacterium sp.]MBP6585420.1 hypothetical protein [Flavobacterium sp.]